MNESMFDTKKQPRRDQCNYRYFSDDRLLITVKQECRRFESQHLLRNHAQAMATLRRITRLGQLIQERTQ